MSRFELLGQELRDTLDTRDTRDDATRRRARQRAAVIERARSAGSTGRRRLVWALAAGLALAAAGALFLLMPRAPSFEIAGHGPGHQGQWLHAPAEEEVVLRFSEGTEATLARSARARVTQLSGDRVRVALESGELRAHVRGGEGLRWEFEAGPFQVTVLGTRLAIDWAPARDHFSVSVARGRVRVQGGMLEGEGVVVTRGQQLVADLERRSVRVGMLAARAAVEKGASALPAAANPSPPPITTTEAQPPASQPAARKPAARPRKPARRRPRKSAAAWRGLARRGAYREALAAVEGQGFDAVVARLSAWDLLLLGDVARLGGDPGRARVALSSLRRRFPQSHAAQLAAFRLARVAMDVERDYAGAARWLRRFLKERPQDRLAADARGRLVEVLIKSGKRAAACRAARDYLGKHPAGPYGALARSACKR